MVPKVSVIVPNYNHARFLRRRLDTILAQTYQDFELILLDDCSTDDSQTILREYGSHPRVSLVIFNETNSGSTFKQWNKGVHLARGKYVWIAESDDYASPRLLERLVLRFEADETCVIAYCRSWRAWGAGRTDGFADGYYPKWNPQGWAADFHMDGRLMCREYFCGTNRIPNASGAVFRRDIYDRVGGADETLRLCGDWKLWAAMALHGSIAYIAEPLSYFRHHQASLRRRTQRATVAVESLAVSLWVRQRIEPPRPKVMRMVYSVQAGLWVPPVVDPRVSVQTKREILRLVAVCDPHPANSAIRYAGQWLTAQAFIAFAKVWYPILDVTLSLRHATGLTRHGFAQIKAKFGR